MSKNYRYYIDSAKDYLRVANDWFKDVGKYILVVISLAVILDLIVKFNNKLALITVKDIDNVCLVLIQIQATMTTLIIATIALLSGFITKSYLGIHLCTYVLDIEPRYFKFKHVLVSEFTLLGLAILFHILKFYNCVFTSCFVSVYILPCFIKNVYLVFANTYEIKEKIKKYILNSIENNDDYKSIGDRLINNWRSDISYNQSEEGFEDYYDVFISLIKRIVSREKDLNTVNDYSEVITNSFLKNDNHSLQKKGVYFVLNFYKDISRWIDENAAEAEKFQEQISLFSRVFRVWWNAVDRDTIKLFNEYVYLIINVLKTSAYFRLKNDNNYTFDQESIYLMARSFGYSTDNKKYFACNDFGSDLIFFTHEGYYLAEKMNDNIKENYYESLAITIFNICCGYLNNGYIDYIDNSVFSELQNKYNLAVYSGEPGQVKCKAVVLEFMLIHCYMYYLAFREDESCVGREKRQRIQECMNNKLNVEKIFNFYSYLAFYCPLVLTAEMEEKLEKILDRQEILTGNTGEKTLIMRDVVRDYFLAIAIWVKSYNSQIFDLSKVLLLEKYLPYLNKNQSDSIKERLVQLLETVDGMGVKFKIHRNFDVFHKEMNKALKNDLINESLLKYEKFDKNICETKIKEKLKNRFYEIFGNDTVASGKGKDFTVKVLTRVDPIFFLVNDIPSAYLTLSFVNFIKNLTSILVNDYNVEKKDITRSYIEDSDFDNCFKDNKYNLLIGDMTIFSSQYDDSIARYYKREAILHDVNKIIIPEADIAIATNNMEFRIRLDDVIVEICSPSKEEVCNYGSRYFIKDEKSGIINFNYYNHCDVIFEEDEFYKFMNNYTQILSVYFKVSIITENDCNEISATVISRTNS